MNIRVIAAEQLTAEQVAAWSDIQRAEPALDSPCFRPEFTQAVAAVRRDVEVGLLEEDGRPVGFFPFQRGPRNMAQPVGGRMSDFQGVIVRRRVTWDPEQLLCGCRLRAWHFDHLVAEQEPFRPFHWKVAPSPYLDLSRGWEGYRAEQEARHRESFRRAIRKMRFAEGEAGPLRVEIDAPRPAVFRSLVAWKVKQYRRTGVTNVLGFDWTVGLLERMLAERSEAFSGMLSALYMGDVLAAVLLSMRSFGVVHAWFSAYRPNFASLSPGLLLWLKLAEALPAAGSDVSIWARGPRNTKHV